MPCLFLPFRWLIHLFQQPTFLSLTGMMPDVHQAILSPLQPEMGKGNNPYGCVNIGLCTKGQHVLTKENSLPPYFYSVALRLLCFHTQTIYFPQAKPNRYLESREVKEPLLFVSWKNTCIKIMICDGMFISTFVSQPFWRQIKKNVDSECLKQLSL